MADVLFENFAPISSEEWRAVASNDNDLREVSPEDFAWRAGGSGLFSWQDGVIIVDKPNDGAMLKALQLAGELGAVLLGDDGEVYSEPEDFLRSPSELPDRVGDDGNNTQS
jgi:hypothetical protein